MRPRRARPPRHVRAPPPGSDGAPRRTASSRRSPRSRSRRRPARPGPRGPAAGTPCAPTTSAARTRIPTVCDRRHRQAEARRVERRSRACPTRYAAMSVLPWPGVRAWPAPSADRGQERDEEDERGQVGRAEDRRQVAARSRHPGPRRRRPPNRCGRRRGGAGRDGRHGGDADVLGSRSPPRPAHPGPDPRRGCRTAARVGPPGVTVSVDGVVRRGPGSSGSSGRR